MSASDAEATRVGELIAKFEGLLKKRRSHDAAKLLREASAIDPNDVRVSAGWDALKLLEDEPQQRVPETCKEYIDSGEEEVGHNAASDCLDAPLSVEEAHEALQLFFNARETLPMSDVIVGNLLGRDEAQKALATMLEQEATKTFRALWQLGERSMQGSLRTLLHTLPWANDEIRIQAGKDVLMLLLAWLLRPEEPHELAMKSIAYLLAAEAPRLESCIDSGNLDIILNHLEVTNPAAMRSQATLATAKFLEAAQDRGRKLLTEFVISRVSNGNTDDLIIALSAAGAVFPVVPSIASPLFLTEGFLDDLLALLNRSKSRTLRKAGLELLSAACIDKTCRTAIAGKCRDWLQSIVDASADPADTALAALVLSKIGSQARAPAEQASTESSQKQSKKTSRDDDLVPKLKAMVIGSNKDSLQSSVEGLAYRSQDSKVKQELALDSNFLEALITAISETPSTGPLVFGGLTIVDNLTKYPPVLSEEQKKLAQLQAYANQAKPAQSDPLDSDERVTARCRKVLDAGIASALMKHYSKASSTVQGIIASIILSTSKHPKHRGEMVQKGLLAPCIAYASLKNDIAAPNISTTRHAAAFALARLLIPVDPSLIFNSRTANAPSATATIKALVPLLSPAEDQADLMPQFEALRALTNLASLQDSNASQNTIITAAFPQIDSLLWSDKTRIQQAAIELINNLIPSPIMATVLLTSSSKVPNISNSPQQRTARLKLIMALTRAENLGVRLAAMGTIAGITAYEFGTERLLKHNKFVEWTLETLFEDDMAMRQRALASLAGTLYPEPFSAEIVEIAVERARMADGLRILRSLEGFVMLDQREIEACISALEGNQGVR